MPCHWSLCFLGSPCYFQDAMPCQWSSGDLPQVLWTWESIFYFLVFFTLLSFLLVLRLPWDGQFNLKVSRASCWSSKHSPSPTICLNHSNPQKGYVGRFYFSFMAGRPTKNLLVKGFKLFSQQAGYVKSHMTFGNRAIQSVITKALVFVVTCVLKVFSCTIVTTNVSVHDVVVILLWW